VADKHLSNSILVVGTERADDDERVHVSCGEQPESNKEKRVHEQSTDQFGCTNWFCSGVAENEVYEP